MPRALVLFSAARPPADNEVRTLVLPHPRGGEPALLHNKKNRGSPAAGAWLA